MAGDKTRTHYNNALRSDLYTVPACGLGVHENNRVKSTVNIDLVTCRRCLKVLRRDIHI